MEETEEGVESDSLDRADRLLKQEGVAEAEQRVGGVGWWVIGTASKAGFGRQQGGVGTERDGSNGALDPAQRVKRGCAAKRLEPAPNGRAVLLGGREEVGLGGDLGDDDGAGGCHHPGPAGGEAGLGDAEGGGAAPATDEAAVVAALLGQEGNIDATIGEGDERRRGDSDASADEGHFLDRLDGKVGEDLVRLSDQQSPVARLNGCALGGNSERRHGIPGRRTDAWARRSAATVCSR